MKTAQQTPAQIASDIKSHLDDACGQLGYDNAEHPWDNSVKRKIARLKKKGVSDIPGRLADDYYNDAQLLADLAGDKLYDLCGSDKQLRNQVLDELDKHGHTALKRAVAKLRRDK